MLSVRFSCAFVLTCLYYTNSEKRIMGGQDVGTAGVKHYMAYLLQAKSSIREYDAWMCGAAIINRWLLLTSAACVEDVQNMYAITGTNVYVRPDELEKNACTRKWKRKVVYTCVPIDYDLQYDNVSKWSYNDIAVVKVELPFSMSPEITRDCPYAPDVIPINFDPEYEKPGTDAIVLGWGHTNMWRLPNNPHDFNYDTLKYASVSVLDNKECKKYFTKPNMGKQIDDYMICTFHEGKLDDMGKPVTNEPLLNYEDDYPDRRRRGEKGICQNDHGGPLVTWINGKGHVIGIASVFRVDHQSHCIGPFLYTSTAKNKEFIECISKDLIHSDDISRRTTICDRPKDGKKFTILRRYIKWTEDGGTDSISLRPQIPMSFYGGK